MKTTVSIAIAIALLLTSAYPAAAKDRWVQYGVSNKVSAYYDAGSIEDIDIDVILVWQKFVKKKIDPKDRIKEYKVLSEFDCMFMRNKEIYIMHIKDDGSIVTFNNAAKWEPIAPGTLDEVLLKTICEEEVP